MRWRLLLPLSALVLGLTAGISDATTKTATTKNTTVKNATVKNTTVKVVKVAGTGAVLAAAASGRTLYTLTDASGDVLPCTDACLAAWPALSVGAGMRTTAPKGVQGLRATADGGVTYRGRPRYFFSGDPTAGSANGNGVQNFGGTWKVVKITGATAKGARAATAGMAGTGAGTTTATTNPVTGYGY